MAEVNNSLGVPSLVN